ncbi:uncharacterized protein [Ptychodera flava]|uniref:uncharacterized protein n=1 Tax=Ptychodera flava TaxID=63121 RepID=UPI00396A0205
MTKDTLPDEVERPEHVFKPSEKEKKERLFRLRYNAKDDKYYRYGDEREEIEGWRNGVYTMVNVRRYKKQQNDCELVYLTRKPGYATASVSWKLDFRDTDLVVDTIQAITYSRTETGGQITYDMATEDPINYRDGSLLNGWQTLVVIAYLDGGIAPCEHSQTQLIYQNITREPDFCPLDITITLKPLQKLCCTCGAKGGPSKPRNDKIEKHKPADTEANEPVCTCTECTCKRYRRKLPDVNYSSKSLEGAKKQGTSSKGKTAKRKTKKPPDKVKIGGKKHRNSNTKDMTLKVPNDVKAPVPDVVVVGDLAENNRTVSGCSDVYELTKSPFGSSTSVRASTSKDLSPKMQRQSLNLNLLNSRTSLGNTKEAWGEKTDDKQNEQTNHDDTTPLTPSREDKKCTIL